MNLPQRLKKNSWLSLMLWLAFLILTVVFLHFWCALPFPWTTNSNGTTGNRGETTCPNLGVGSKITNCDLKRCTACASFENPMNFAT